MSEATFGKGITAGLALLLKSFGCNPNSLELARIADYWRFATLEFVQAVASGLNASEAYRQFSGERQERRRIEFFMKESRGRPVRREQSNSRE